MTVTAEMNMMMSQLNSLAGTTASQTPTLNHEQVNGFSKIGLTTKSIKEHYSELDISKWKGSELFFGGELNELPEEVFFKTPSPDVLNYVQKRKQTIDDLVQAFELAQKVSKPEETPALLKAFVSMCNDARTEAIKDNHKGLDSMDSVHVIELEKAARKAAEGDKQLSSILSRDSKAYINNPILMAATLKVLKERQEGLHQLESSYTKDTVKNGPAGHIADFFREEWMPLAIFGSYFRKVNALNAKGLPIALEAMRGKDSLGLLPGLKFNKDLGKWTHQVGKGFDATFPAIADDISVVCKKRLAIGQTWDNLCRKPASIRNWLGNIGPNLRNMKVPGGKLGACVMVAGLVWAGVETYCYAKNNPKWFKPIADTYAKMTEDSSFLGLSFPGSSALAVAGSWLIPDFGKLAGYPLFTSHKLDRLNKEFKEKDL